MAERSLELLSVGIEAGAAAQHETVPVSLLQKESAREK